jgi:predicted 2-oxoglutarate/Fe(II)-dependent dioxygenase YbiX
MARMLAPGEPTPWFHAQAMNGSSNYAFDTAAGRYILLLFLDSAGTGEAQAALALLRAHRALFDDDRACFFGVSADPEDEATGRIAPLLPGIRWFLDYDRRITTLYGGATGWVLLDPLLRVVRHTGLGDGAAVLNMLAGLVAAPLLVDSFAPVLVIPGVLSRELCCELIQVYDRNGGRESGFMREENGITVARFDHRHKRRADHLIKDDALIERLKVRVALALCPMIKRAFQFDATRIERFLVACYDAEHGGHFRAHRDNTTAGTAHRKFAVTINLNADDYDGGDLRFPEFGPRTYRAPTGGAVVFSCSLLHEARPVTRGKRYAFLPFLYDDESARLRERNLAFVSPELQRYRSGLDTSANAAPVTSPSSTSPVAACP